MKLVIKQKPENGILGGPKSIVLSVHLNNADYQLAIDQGVERMITIITSSSDYRNMLTAYYTLKTLLMLFDGQFYPVITAYDGADVTQAWKERSLPSYTSADYMIGAWNKLLDFEKVLTVDRFLKWYSIKNELDMVYNMMLYCLSNVKMPVDVKCAFMVESCKGLHELAQSKNPDFTNKASLKKSISEVANRYGIDIFEKELGCNEKRFIEILADSRNKIAHIKSRQDETYLDGNECIIYLKKLSFLYRVLLFDLLDIPKSLYYDKLLSQVHLLDEQETTKRFLDNINLVSLS